MSSPFKRCASLLLAAGLNQLAGCALMSRGDTMQVRYFTLDDSRHAQAAGAKSDLLLRLGRVEASGGLGEQIAVRTHQGAHELGYRDDQRWTEKPAQFVRRELERALFDERGLMRSYSGVTPTLEVELTELELVDGERAQARVRLRAQVRDERRSLCQDNFETQLPIGDSNANDARADMERSVSVLATALHKTVEDVAARAVQCLSEQSPAKPGARAAGPEQPAAAVAEAE